MSTSRTSEPIVLAPGITGYLPDEMGIGLVMAQPYVEEVWVRAGEPWQVAARMTCAFAIVYLARVEGLPADLSWPPLPWEIDSPEGTAALDARFKALGNIGLTLTGIGQIAGAVKRQTEVTTEEAKKSAGSSAGASTSGPPGGR